MDTKGLAASTVTTSVEDAVSVGLAPTVVPLSVATKQTVSVPVDPSAV